MTDVECSQMANDSWELAYHFIDSKKFLHPALYSNLESAALSGTKLFSVEKLQSLFKDTFNWVWDNYERRDDFYFDIELVYYAYHHIFGWGPPSGNDVELISKYMNSDVLLDIGCGTAYWSKVLSHYHNVIAIDNSSEDSNWRYIWYDRLNVDALIEYKKFEKPFSVIVYPRVKVIQNIFREAQIGSRFYIKIPPLAGMPSDLIKWIINSSKVLHHNIQCWTSDKKPLDGYGVIVEKIKNIDIIPIKKDPQALSSFFDQRTNYHNWFEAYYETKKTRRKSFRIKS